MNAIYLEGKHDGWIINLMGDGIQVISPGIGELKVEIAASNTINVFEGGPTDER